MPNQLKVNLASFFQAIKDEPYVVIKPSAQLPGYTPGSDIDIFCYHPSKMIEAITSYLSKYVDHRCKINIVDDEDKAHIDLIVDDKIDIRFDLYKRLPTYKNISLKESFFSSVIESSILEERQNEFGQAFIRVPSSADDFILRYVEYHEYYAQRPDKIKHIEYIESFISDLDKKMALDKLHFYTAFPKVAYKEKTRKEKIGEKISYYGDMIHKVKHLYHQGGVKSVVSKIKKKLG